MTRDYRYWRACGTAIVWATISVILPFPPATAQDIRGLEKCTAEAQMERRTGCLQANIEFLHQALTKLERDTREKINALTRDLAASRAEVTVLRSTVAKLDGEVAMLKAKADTGTKK